MDTTTTPTRFTDTEGEELASYQPLSRWAVCALVCGLFSFLSLLHPVMLIVPATGILAALIAARQLSSSELPRTGQAAMKWGLFLSLAWSACSVTELWYRRGQIEGEARQCAERWLALVQDGKIHEAHQLTLTNEQRVAGGVSLARHYEPREKTKPAPGSGGRPDPEAMMRAMVETQPHIALEGFVADPLMDRLLKLGKKARYAYQAEAGQVQMSPMQVAIGLLYTVQSDEPGQPAPFEVRVNLERTEADGVASWRVIGVKPP